MTAMSQPGDNASGKVIRLEARRVERRVPGIGTAVFRAPSVDDDMRLAQFYDAEAPDHRAFVNETVAATLESPMVDAADVDLWTERARALARVAVAEAADCRRDYRRLAGSGLTGDERLFRAVRALRAPARATSERRGGGGRQRRPPVRTDPEGSAAVGRA
jgi:hypothetical protein